jgi:hypothetical protein
VSGRSSEAFVQIPVLPGIDTNAAVGVFCQADRFGPGITHRELQAVCEAPFELSLQRIVLTAADRLNPASVGGASETLKQGSPSLTRTNHFAGVRICPRHLAS